MTDSRRNALIVLAALAAAAAGFGANRWWRVGSSAAPDGIAQLMALSLPDVAGRPQAMAQWRGRLLLVNFWATDCVTCVKEMPEIVSTYNKFRDRGFETIAVAMRHDPPNYVLNYTEKNRLPFKVALDPLGELAKSFGEVKLTPTTFVIDKQGNVVTRILGEPDFAKLHALLEQKLGET